MKGKKEYLVLLLVIAGLVAYLFAQKKGELHYALPELSKLEQKRVTQVTVSKGDATITITRDNDRWRIQPEGFPADSGVVDEMVEKAKDVRLTALASESRNYGIYQLEDHEKIGVVLTDGETELRQIDIGKRAPSSRHTFVKLKDDHRVFHADGDLVTLFDKTVSDLRDKIVMKIDDHIAGIAITTPSGTLNLARATPEVSDDGTDPAEKPSAETPTAPQWQKETGEPVADTQVAALLGHLKNLRCDDFIDGKAKTDLIDPAYSISLTATKAYELSLFPSPDDAETPKAYEATSSQSDYPFLLPEWKAKQIIEALDKLLQSPTPDS